MVPLWFCACVIPVGFQTWPRNANLPGKPMTCNEFLVHLQAHAAAFAKAVATNGGDWIIKGFIDIYRQIYTVSVDTKIVSQSA